MNTNNPLAALSEQHLLQRFAELVRRDRSNTALLLAHMAEIDERKLWAKHACSSMFAFCMERFHMSESMAGKRIWAARTAWRFPLILSMLGRGELHLSGINQLGKHLTQTNHRSVLERARHKSSREIAVLVAELDPRPDVPSRVRALPMPSRLATGTVLSTEGAVPPNEGTVASAGDVVPSTEAHPADAMANPADAPAQPADAASKRSPNVFNPTTNRDAIVALAPKRFKIEITVDQATHDRLRSLQDLLRHQIPSADPAMIVSRAIALLLDDTLAKKAAVTATQRPGRRPHGTRTRAIPAAVRREVWKRDLGRCTFVDERGRPCRATSCVEYHHEMPYGKGGGHEAENIALRCRAHNQYQADLDFGRAFMARKRHGSGLHAARNVGEAHRPAGETTGEADER